GLLPTDRGPLHALPGHVVVGHRHCARGAGARTAARLGAPGSGVRVDAAAAPNPRAEALSRWPANGDARHCSAQGRYEPRDASGHARFGRAAPGRGIARRAVWLELRLPEEWATA